MFTLHRAGGRIKSAGLGLDALFPDEAQGYEKDPSPQRAGLLRTAILDLQTNPPPQLLAAFFPHKRTTIRGYLARSGLYRPFLKTDQGPPGVFLPFVTGGGDAVRTYRIARREGVAIPEVHVSKSLDGNTAARQAGDRLGAHYREHRLEDCWRSLDELSTHIGFERRKADVGRGLFFFCNAAAAETPVTIPEHVCARVEEVVNDLLSRAAAKAAHVKALYRGGTSLPEAMASARAADPAGAGLHSRSGLYLQADVYLTSDGDITVEQVQLPDVGLFLTELPQGDHVILPEVQRVVRSLRERTQELLGQLPSPAYLLTRESVLRDQTDTLEHLEIRALRNMAAEVGLELRVGSPQDVAGIPAGAHVLLLNVDPASPDCETLLRRSAHDEIACTPDPFLKLFASELTTQRRVPVRGKQLERFLQSIRPGRTMTEGSFHAIHQGVERIYRYGGLSAEILHFEVPGERTLVPTLKHSVHSFTSLYNRCSRHDFPDLHIREVPVNRTNAILHGEWGPHLCALRFYFTRT